MSIERTSPLTPTSPVSNRDSQEVSTSRGVKSEVPDAANVSTNVTLSDAQSQLMQPGNGDIDMGRVEALKQAIRNGELRMDTGKIADALIKQSWELTQNESE